MITQVALSLHAHMRKYGIPMTDEDNDRLFETWSVGKTEQEKKLARIVMDGYEQLWKEFEEGKFAADDFDRISTERVMEMKRLYDITPAEQN